MIDELIRTIKKAGEALSLTDARTNQAIAATHQIEQTGYLTYEELIQLSVCLPGIIPALCRKMRIDTSELSYRLEQGLIPTEEAFTELTATIHNHFLVIRS